MTFTLGTFVQRLTELWFEAHRFDRRRPGSHKGRPPRRQMISSISRPCSTLVVNLVPRGVSQLSTSGCRVLRSLRRRHSVSRTDRGVCCSTQKQPRSRCRQRAGRTWHPAVQAVVVVVEFHLLARRVVNQDHRVELAGGCGGLRDEGVPGVEVHGVEVGILGPRSGAAMRAVSDGRRQGDAISYVPMPV